MKKLVAKKQVLKSKPKTKANLKKLVKLVKKQIELATKLAKHIASSKQPKKFDIKASITKLTGELANFKALAKAAKF